MTLFKRQPKTPPGPCRPLPPPSFTQTFLPKVQVGLSLDQWQASEERVNWARDLFKQRLGADLLSCLLQELPDPHDFPAEQAQFEAGIVHGYRLCLRVMLSLAETPPVAPAFPEATYEAPDTFPTDEPE